MKKFISVFFAGFMMLWGVSAIAEAKSYTQPQQNINRRQRRQQRRIRGGYRSGRLTRREASRLERREVRTNRMERRFRRSGNGLSRRERRRLAINLNRNSRRIYRQKHDRQRRRY
ncbi:MAG: hypothetical protein ABJA66_14065 [Actinomycetota bacterium]